MLTAAAVYTFCVAIQWQAVWWGWVDASVVSAYSVFVIGGVAAFYVTIRRGINLRFAEPALTMPQMVFAMLCLAIGYMINTNVRGMLLVVVALVLVFGAFTVPPKGCRQLGWIAVALLGSVMAFGVWHHPLLIEPRLELVHFLFTAVVLPTISFLAGQLSQLRLDHQQQRRELREAMQRMQSMAMHDELTGLPNRRHMQEWMSHELARSFRSGAPLCLAIIDLDQFKRINDTHGHAVGDDVLRIFAREARAMLRDGDMLARWGGEEFLLVMPDTTLDDGQRALHRLRHHMRQPSRWADCPQGQVTFSAGLTTREHAQTLEEAAQRADEALYQAKRDGRDRVVAAPTLHVPRPALA